MSVENPILVTGVGGGSSNIGRLVAELLLDADEPVRVMIHRPDERADELRARGAEVVVGDLVEPVDVARALDGARRVFFNMAVSDQYLRAAAVMCSLMVERGDLQVLVNMSQMTVSQMTSVSTEESDQQRLHWLVEKVEAWSGVPVVQVRPTVFLDNPMFTLVPRQGIASRGVLELPIGSGRTSPVAATDVARVVATILQDPTGHVGKVYELTGPEVLNVVGLAERYSAALGREIAGADMPAQIFEKVMSSAPNISPHVVQHVLTVAKLHRSGRYDRLTDDVQAVTGQPAQSVTAYIAAHRDLFGG